MIFDAATGQILHQMKGHSRWATAVAWSHDGQRVASVSDDGTVRLWDASIGKQITVFRGHEAPVNHVDWSRDDAQIVGSGNDNYIIVFSVSFVCDR